MIHKEIIEDYEETLDRITYYEESEDRADILKEMVTSLPRRFLKEI